MSYSQIGVNESTTPMTYLSTPVTIGPFVRFNRSMIHSGRLPPPRPTDYKSVENGSMCKPCSLGRKFKKTGTDLQTQRSEKSKEKDG
ncbi:hypothetical protein CDAR_77071 [Caerostris darwini]|uniref:Uncharacterized protein n=1 Tax=Caerostris darwini TaxID=1538125 RepID=A0AAV4RAC4_9ARAC|nr:hypothetical protein CDAR_77071 [Caerostris darwini]